MLMVISVSFLSCDFTNEVNFTPSRFIGQDPLVLLIKHRQDEYSGEVSDQVTQALSYAKIPVETMDLGLLSEDFTIPGSVRVIAVTTFLVSELNTREIQEFTRFVASGNVVVFLGPVTFDDFTFLQGINPFSEYAFDSLSTGVFFLDNVFPGHNGRSYKPEVGTPHKGITQDQFTKRVKVHASAGSDLDYPLLLSNEIGLGEVITVNSFALDEKLYRGMVFSSILKGLEGLPYSVANVSTIFLDDFPAPLYNEQLAPIDEEYGMTHAEFVSDQWWPDMQAFADTFDIDYSAMTAFNYNAKVVPPFDFNEWTLGKINIDGRQVDGSIYLAKDIAEGRHELAFHGYNHFSLWLEDWDNVNFMANSVLAARKRWRIDGLGDLPVTYVPPTNYIDSVGISAILKGMPSIRYMSSLYLGNIEDGEGREFGFDPYAPYRLFNYPRSASGFTMEDNSLFDQQSLQVLTGIWNHFIHPDDVFQVEQREEDGFKSRNPLKLGWKSHPVYGYGLYHELRERVLFTKERYPLTRFLAAEEGGAVTEDWTNIFVGFEEKDDTYSLLTESRAGYENKSGLSDEKFWFSYVSEENRDSFEASLIEQELTYESSKLWDGFLFQFSSEKDSLSFPNLRKSAILDPQFVQARIGEAVEKGRLYRTTLNEDYAALVGISTIESEYVDTRYEDAIRAYNRRPDNKKVQEDLITLSIEFGDVLRAITILERRMLASQSWSQNDIERLFLFYGWEKLPNQAENFLERLWLRYPSPEVIDVKNYAVASMGLYSEEFVLRWSERERGFKPDDEALSIRYTRLIENQENWPVVKKELRRLLSLYPRSDSLYAYTLQRSFYYEKSDSSTSLVEEFPIAAHDQIDVFASNLAFYYGYDFKNYSRALYWANRAEGFDEKIKLQWLSEMNLYSEFQNKADQLLLENPDDDSLRTLIGTQLYYEGFTDKAMEILYPLFVDKSSENTVAGSLMNSEISYMTYEKRKELYKKYPAFFSQREFDRLYSEYRWFEGTRLSLYGEFRNDNFDNVFARFGTSSQFGDRKKIAHLVKIEDLYFENSGGDGSAQNNFVGAGYEFQKRSSDQSMEYKMGLGLYSGSNEVLGEGFASISYSYDSTFTSGRLYFGPVLTNAAIDNNYYKTQLEAYREDIWGKDSFTTSLSGVARYYTNSVFEYEFTGRLYLQPFKQKIRLRPIAELAWADASDSFLSGIPYYTPDQFFSKGVGFDLRYRNPDNFDFLSLLELEVMGKHETADGFYGTGRIQFQNKFKKYWEIRVGSEISTSQIYRSNRFFFTLSYYLDPKPKMDKQN